MKTFGFTTINVSEKPQLSKSGYLWFSGVGRVFTKLTLTVIVF